MDTAPPLPAMPGSLLPSRRIRLAAVAARVLLWLVLGFWLLAGLSWGLLQGWIVPRISEFRPHLEARASALLGAPVRIGSISARSQGLVPSFELTEVTLLDRDGQVALRLPSVIAAVSPTSLWNLGFEQLVIERAELDIRRRADGQLELAGIDLSKPAGGGATAFANWALTQEELVLRGSLVRWSDELRDTPPLVLTDVQAVLRNPGQRHLIRIDATPPPAWGEPFNLRALLREPLLPVRGSAWQHWSGQIYGEFSRADVAQLRRYLDLSQFGLDVASGHGSLRAWVDVTKGQVGGGTADVALEGVSAQLGQNLSPLTLRSVAGRFGGQQLANGFDFRTEGLSFVTDDGLVWPGGNVALLHTGAEGRQPARTELKADRLDLAALARIAKRLPLGDASHAQIESFAPQGLLEQLEADWQGPLSAPLNLSARGRASGLSLAAGPAQVKTNSNGIVTAAPGRPGLQNATLDFTLAPGGGQAQLQITQGSVDFPGVFEQPRVPFTSLSTELVWTHQEGRHALQLRKLRFANADAQGQAELRWQSADVAGQPGSLDLQGRLSRGSGQQVHRYLPLVLPESTRHYVRDAVLQGQLDDVRFKVKGDLQHLPFADPKQGDFLITAKASKVRYAYVPPKLTSNAVAALTRAWPALDGLQGELVFNRRGMEVRNVQGRVAGLGLLQLTQGSARIRDLAAPVVEINTSVKGPLAQGLQFVNTSPVSGLLGDSLLLATANGAADYSMQLQLPLRDMASVSLQGRLTLPGNDVQFRPDTPQLARLRGALTFTENSFKVSNAQARLLGGDVRFDGAMRPTLASSSGRSNSAEPLEAPIQFRAQGTVSADGLRQATELGLVAGLARQASGNTNYSASLDFRRGQAELSVKSSLQGLALGLPAPLDKSAAEALPLQFDRVLLRESMAPGQNLQDQLSISLGRLASARYVRDLNGPAPRVLRGSITVGVEANDSAPLRGNEVLANLSLGRADLDAWRKVLGGVDSASPAAGGLASGSNFTGYLPSSLTLRANELTVQGYPLRQLVLGVTRVGSLWRANINAEELSGYAEFRQPGTGPGATPGLLYARLSRLRLAASSARDVEALLEGQPAAIPALDIVVEDMELRGKKLGRLEVEAINRNPQAPPTAAGTAPTPGSSALREWRLSKLKLSMPEAVFSATGNWIAPQSTSIVRRRVLMDFRLDVADSGGLLTRLGMEGLVRRGKGQLEGQVSWLGSPLSLDYPTLGGQFKVQIENGQFLKAEPGIAKLLGVLSLQALPRRLTLDFRDVFSEGFAFDYVRGDVSIDQGLARTNNLQMKGVNAAVMMEGSANIARETQDLRVVVIPEVTAGTASLIAGAINPLVGLSSYLAQTFLRRPLTEAATKEFHIDGAWSDPRITRVERKPTSDSAPESPRP